MEMPNENKVIAFPIKKICRHCRKFFSSYRCNAPDECDCPRCQGFCECDKEATK